MDVKIMAANALVIYVVTDIEADGPTPGENSMLSFASVAIGEDGTEYSSFETVLQSLSGAKPHAATLAWFATQPDAYAAATHDPKPIDVEMQRYRDWLSELPGRPVFAAHPLGFDGPWVDYYLRRFLQTPLLAMPWQTSRIFHGAGLCIRSFAKGVLGPDTPAPNAYPTAWLGNHAHTHRAIDDARGYASLLRHLMQVAQQK
jgi:hypothetical protein